MKKIFFLAIAATLLAAGCQKTEVLNQVNPVDGSAMTFAPNMGKLTKAPTAEGAGETNLSEQDFRLWAYYVAEDPNRGAAANSIYDGMENIAVTNGTDGWSTSPVHFWPGKGKQLKFFAVSADSGTYGAEKSKSTDAENATKVSITPDETGGTLKVTNFVVSNTAPDVDLMIADYTTGQQKNDNVGNNNVDLIFRHALAKVEFSFKNEMAKENDPNAVIVQHMYVDNVINKGTVSVANLDGSVEFTEWAQSAEATDKVRFGGDFTANTSLPEDIAPAENLEQYTGADNATPVPTGHEMLLTATAQTYTTWLVIPQTVATSTTDAAGLHVVIAYLIGNRQFVARFPLYSQNALTWNPNQYIKYNVSLSPNMIGFNPTVEDWAPVVRDPATDPESAPNNPSNDGENITIN